MQDKIQIQIGEDTRTLKMTYGLLDELSKTVGDIDSIPMMSVDPELRSAVLNSILSERDQFGTITKKADLWNLDMDMEAVQALLDWAGANILDFFLTALERSKKLAESNEKRMKALIPTSNGGQV